MDSELKIKVVLDTSDAKKELDGLVTNAATTGKRASGFLSQAMGAGMRAVGMGVGFSAAQSALQGPLFSGISDVMGEALGGVGKSLELAALGNLGNEARAQKAAREDTIQAFGTISGIQNSVAPGSHEYFSSRMGIHLREEKGRSLMESDPVMRDVNLEKVVNKLATEFGKSFKGACDMFAREMNKW